MPTQQQIAEHLDLDQSAVSRFVDKARLDYKTASMDEIRVAYIRHLREVAAGRASETGIDLVAERAMTERVDREIKLLTLAEKKGQLVNAAQLEQAYGLMVGAFQTEVVYRSQTHGRGRRCAGVSAAVTRRFAKLLCPASAGFCF